MLRFDKVDHWLSSAKDWHLPISIFIFLTGSVMQWFHHLDTVYVGFVATVLGAITGHCFSPAGQPDKADGGDNAK